MALRDADCVGGWLGKVRGKVREYTHGAAREAPPARGLTVERRRRGESGHALVPEQGLEGEGACGSKDGGDVFRAGHFRDSAGVYILVSRGHSDGPGLRTPAKPPREGVWCWLSQRPASLGCRRCACCGGVRERAPRRGDSSPCLPQCLSSTLY